MTNRILSSILFSLGILLTHCSTGDLLPDLKQPPRETPDLALTPESRFSCKEQLLKARCEQSHKEVCTYIDSISTQHPGLCIRTRKYRASLQKMPKQSDTSAYREWKNQIADEYLQNQNFPHPVTCSSLIEIEPTEAEVEQCTQGRSPRADLVVPNALSVDSPGEGDVPTEVPSGLDQNA